MEFSVKANVEQWNALLSLLDIAVKSKGLEAALACGFWDKMIKEAAEEFQKQEAKKAEDAKIAAEAEKLAKQKEEANSGIKPDLKIVDTE